jgi:hypothetical protein
MPVGANVAYSTLDQMNAAPSVGDFIFNGRATGLGLVDFLTGQVRSSVTARLAHYQSVHRPHTQDT